MSLSFIYCVTMVQTLNRVDSGHTQDQVAAWKIIQPLLEAIAGINLS